MTSPGRPVGDDERAVSMTELDEDDFETILPRDGRTVRVAFEQSPDGNVTTRTIWHVGVAAVPQRAMPERIVCEHCGDEVESDRLLKHRHPGVRPIFRFVDRRPGPSDSEESPM